MHIYKIIFEIVGVGIFEWKTKNNSIEDALADFKECEINGFVTLLEIISL